MVDFYVCCINIDYVYIQSFNDFKMKGEFPRFPEDEAMAVTIDQVDVDNALIVFISHW